MNKLIEFLQNTLSNSLTNNASTRRVVYFGFATLGAICMAFALGWATSLIVGVPASGAFVFFDRTLSFAEYIFISGSGIAAGLYGWTKVAEVKGGKPDASNQ